MSMRGLIKRGFLKRGLLKRRFPKTSRAGEDNRRSEEKCS